jgi:hypothetical protein
MAEIWALIEVWSLTVTRLAAYEVQNGGPSETLAIT